MTRFSPRLPLLIGLAAAAALLRPLPALAQSDIFVCTDEQGRKTYQNTGTTRGCKRLEVRPIVTIPAPKLPPQQRMAEAQATPVNFPRIDADTQRQRDQERRRILQDEVKAEEERLARLRQDFNDGQPERNGDETRNYARYQERVARMQEDITRAESNLAALRRELSLIR